MILTVTGVDNEPVQFDRESLSSLGLETVETMSIRDKGPLWVVYPYDSSADYRTEVIYSRSIWQLDRIEVVD